MSPYRLDRLHVQDEEFGPLVLRGDGFAAAGELPTLLANDDVIRALGLSDDERREAGEIVATFRERLSGLYAGGQNVPASLDPRARPLKTHLEEETARRFGTDRLERLKRLSWRIRGGEALHDSDVAEALHLTPEQRTAIGEEMGRAESDAARILRGVSHVRDARLSGPQSLETAGRAALRDSSERLMAVLTAEQRDAFEVLRRRR